MAQRAFQTLYPTTTDLVAAFEKARLPHVAEGIVLSHMWCAVSLCKIVGGSLADLHKLLDSAWEVVQPDTTAAGKAAQKVAASRLVGADGNAIADAVVPTAAPGEPVRDPVATGGDICAACVGGDHSGHQRGMGGIHIGCACGWKPGAGEASGNLEKHLKGTPG